MPTLLTTRDIAVQLGTSESNVRQMRLRDPYFPKVFQQVGNSKFYLASDVRKYVNRRKTA